MSNVHYTATVLKFARDALTDARSAATTDNSPQVQAAQVAHDRAAQAHGAALRASGAFGFGRAR